MRMHVGAKVADASPLSCRLVATLHPFRPPWPYLSLYSRAVYPCRELIATEGPRRDLRLTPVKRTVYRIIITPPVILRRTADERTSERPSTKRQGVSLSGKWSDRGEKLCFCDRRGLWREGSGRWEEKYVGFGVRESVRASARWQWPKDFYHDLPLTTLQFRTVPFELEAGPRPRLYHLPTLHFTDAG